MLERVLKNFSYILSANIVIRAIALITQLFVIWTFLPADLGLYAIVFSVGSIIIPFTFSGITTFVIRDVASDKKKRKSIISTSLLFINLMGILIGIVIFFCIGFVGEFIGVGKDTISLIRFFVPFYIFLSINSGMFNAVFQGLQEFGKYSLMIVLQTLTLFFVVTGLYFTSNLTVATFLFATIISYAIPCATSFLLTLKYLTSKLDFRWFKSALKETLIRSPTDFMKKIQGDGIYLLLGAVTSRVEVGYLKFAFFLVDAIATAPTLLSQVLYPMIAEIRLKERISGMVNAFIRYSFAYQIFVTTIGVVFFTEIVTIIGLAEYSAAFGIFVLLAVWQLITIPVLINRNVLFAKKATFLVTKYTFVGFIAFIVLLPSVYLYGLIGVGLVLIAAGTGAAIFSFKYVRRHVKIEIPANYIAKSLILSGATIAEIWLLRSILPSIVAIPICFVTLVITWFIGYSYFILEKEDRNFLKRVLHILSGKRIYPKLQG